MKIQESANLYLGIQLSFVDHAGHATSRLNGEA